MLGLRAGAVGFLTKDLDVDVLPHALRGALDGRGRDLAPARHAARRAAAHARRRARAGCGPVKSPLTAARVGGHRPARRGARRPIRSPSALVLSGETVRSHVKNILRKLDVGSREEAVAAAQRMRGGPSETGRRG